MSGPENTAPTLFLLMAQSRQNGRADRPGLPRFFGHLSVDKLVRKALRGDLALPITRIEGSQKAQRGVHLVDSRLTSINVGPPLSESVSN